MRPAGIHRTAVIGSPPEHRDWQVGDAKYEPEIDATAIVNAFCTIDAGVAGPTRVGAGAFLMAGCHVGHDAEIGENCELAPRTVIGGHAVLEDGVRCGIGVLVLPFKRVGAGARLGAGAVVTKDVPAGEVWVGCPAGPLNAAVVDENNVDIVRGVWVGKTGTVRDFDEMAAWEEWYEASRRLRDYAAEAFA